MPIAFASASAASMLARDGGCLEQGEADERPLEPGCVRVDDPIALDGQPHSGVVLTARRVADQLEPRHPRRLPAGFGAEPRPVGDQNRGQVFHVPRREGKSGRRHRGTWKT